MTDRTRGFRALLLSAVLASAGQALLRAAPPGGRERWELTNHAGRAVGLYAGPAAALGTAVAAGRVRPAAGVAVLAAGVCGAYDDVAGDHRRGFRAHLGGLRDSEVTSGAVKLFGIAAAAPVAGSLLRERPADKVPAGVVIAGAAHRANLVDAGPVGAAGVVLALAGPGLLRKGPGARPVAAAQRGAAAVLPHDLAERVMLGGTGAHALGAALGAAVAVGRGSPRATGAGITGGRRGLLAHAAVVVAATVFGDRVSAWARSP